MVSDIVSILTKDSVPFGYSSHESVNESPGLYCFWLRNACLYVGMSTNLKRRLIQHCTMEDNPILKSHFHTYANEISLSLAYKNVAEKDLRSLESRAISKLRPLANRQGNP